MEVKDFEIDLGHILSLPCWKSGIQRANEKWKKHTNIIGG